MVSIMLSGCGNRSERYKLSIFEFTAAAETEICKSDECKELMKKRLQEKRR